MTQGARRARPQRGRIGRAHLRRHAAVAADGRRARSGRSPSGRASDGAALLVVGAVAGLREHLRWFDDRPLFGRRIVVTRSREQAGELVDMLEDRGAEAIQAPTIRIAPPEDPDALDRACADAGTFDWIIFTSANARRSLHGAAARDRRRPRSQGRAPLHGRAVDRGAARAVRHSHRPDAGGVSAAKRWSRSLRELRALDGVRVPAPARRHRARAAGRRAARRGRRGRRGRRLPHGARRRRARAKTTSTGCCSIGRSTPSRSRARRRSGTSRRCSGRIRPPICCARRSSRASVR